MCCGFSLGVDRYEWSQLLREREQEQGDDMNAMYSGSLMMYSNENKNYMLIEF